LKDGDLIEIALLNGMVVRVGADAQRVLEHLERSNYVIMRGPPVKTWIAPGKPSIPMKD